jgi:hypothetical protein
MELIIGSISYLKKIDTKTLRGCFCILCVLCQRLETGTFSKYKK